MKTKEKRIKDRSRYKIAEKLLQQEFWKIAKVLELYKKGMAVPDGKISDFIAALDKAKKKYLRLYKKWPWEEERIEIAKKVDEIIVELKKQVRKPKGKRERKNEKTDDKKS